jgi:hypothetical protein
VREHQAQRDSSADVAGSKVAAIAPAAADVVVSLQRSLGNRAVTRLLARQEDVEPTGPSVPTRIDRDDPLIQTVRGPILGERGRYRWLVRYQLPFPADRDGWLIQELYQESSGGANEHFWECWRVRRGERYPDDPVVEEGILYDDRYVNGRGAETPDATGWHRHTGVIRFYPGPIPPEFPLIGGASSSVTWTQPTGWTGQGMRHDAYSEWDYPGGRRRLNGFVAYAGTTELRSGDGVTFRPRTSTGPTRLDTEAEAVPQRI